MRHSHLTLNIGIVLMAAVLAVLVAMIAAAGVENSALNDIESRFRLEGIEGVEIQTSGLQVTLSGEVASEAARFRAITVAGEVVDTARVVDQIRVTPAQNLPPPKFSIEILRNEQGISLIGLVPVSMDRQKFAERIQAIAEGSEVVDLLQDADYPVPGGWESALAFSLNALERLPRSKISMEAGIVSVTAIAGSAGEKRTLEEDLARQVPGGLDLELKISAPRPVITPFTLRFLIEDGVARFDACTAHSETGRADILTAARAAGVRGEIHCPVALGAPTKDWNLAVMAAIRAVREFGGGSVTFSDADITLVAPDTIAPPVFDKVTGELEAALPEVFSLHAILPEPVLVDRAAAGNDPAVAEFVATMSPEGLVQLRGRLRDEVERDVAESFARARFGIDRVYVATRLDAELPQGWLVRVLAGIESLSLLENGSVVVQGNVVDIQGVTGNPDARFEIARLMSEKLGEAENFRIDVTYDEALDPQAALPSPQECVDRINAVLAERKVTFAAGSAEIDPQAEATIDRIAEIMQECQDVAMEIGGYTDSQGREEMNLSLSQARAQAVLNALLARRVLTTNLVAHGYGEENPVADNDTEAGREANRRIEFRLLVSTGESGEAGGDGAGQGERDPAHDPHPEATGTQTDMAAGQAQQ